MGLGEGRAIPEQQRSVKQRQRRPRLFPELVLERAELPEFTADRLKEAIKAEGLSDKTRKQALSGAAKAVTSSLTREDLFSKFLTEPGVRGQWESKQGYYRKRDVKAFVAFLEGKSLREFASSVSPNFPIPELGALCCFHSVAAGEIDRDTLKAELRFRQSVMGYASKIREQLRNPRILSLLEEDVTNLHLLLFQREPKEERKSLPRGKLSSQELRILDGLARDPENFHQDGAWRGHPDWKQIAGLFFKHTGRRVKAERLNHYHYHNNLSDEERKQQVAATATRTERNRSAKEKRQAENIELARQYPELFPSLKQDPRTKQWSFDSITHPERVRLGTLRRGLTPWTPDEEEALKEIYNEPAQWRTTVRAKRERLSLQRVTDALNERCGKNRDTKQVQNKFRELGIKTYRD